MDTNNEIRVPILKRSCDVLVSSLGLLLLSPLLGIVAVFIKMDSRGPVLFRQERIGQGFRKFAICKFRTMVVGASQLGGPLTTAADPRITRVGQILRKTKIDELPQFINVLRGDMSLVGPRPEVPKYVNLFRRDYEEILRVRPGITDLASLKYRDETALLLDSDPEQAYITRILPDKIALAKEYARQSSFCFDLSLIVKTITRILLDVIVGQNTLKKRSPIRFPKI
jgi:lipopolysaccharide/colanic/teichoic acid biosynthesis glycosyltransferase